MQYAVQPAIAAPAGAAATSLAWRAVSYGGVTLRAPASWPVINLSRDTRACPRLNRHAIYLGKPGADPACPAELSGKTGSVQILPIDLASPDARTASRPTVIAGSNSRTNPDQAITHSIIDIIPAAGMEVSLSYGNDLPLIRRIQSSLQIIRRQGKLATQRQARALAAVAASLPAAATPAAVPQGIYQGPGFDTCAAPSAASMKSWLRSPYRAVGVYIGGINRACAQANLTSSWLATIRTQGWRYFPFYVGLQADCVFGFGDATIIAAKAAAEGRAAADDASLQAKNLGIPAGTPIIFDMEAYASCGQQVVTFLSAWDAELHADGFQAGVYESFSNIGDLLSAAGTMTEPDVIHYADWDGKATTTSSYMPANRWTSHQRLHQYQGGHNETWGNVTLNIDNDQLDVNLGGGNVPRPASFRIALGMNSNGTAEWFARTAGGTVVHSYQRPVGATTWAPSRAVGNSPRNLVSNPAVTSDQNGSLTLFAVAQGGLVVHAWQQSGAPNGWTWAGPAGSGSPGAVAGDPAAIREPGGAVGVFVTDAAGAVMTTHQTAPNANASWTTWTAIGGHCASTPVPFAQGATGLAVACTTASGSVAVSSLAGGTWSPWRQAGALSGATDIPAVVTTPGGQTDILTVTSAGRTAVAYQDKASAAWAAGASLPASPGAQGSPAAISWPGGGIAAFSQLPGGDLGYTVGSGGGAGGWAPWTDLRIAMVGSPTAWRDTSGEPQAVVISAARKLAVAGYVSGSWTAWASLVGGF
jgi:hypothetical protein